MTAKNPTKDAQNDREYREDEGNELVGATPHHVDDQGRQPQAKDHTGAVLLQDRVFWMCHGASFVNRRFVTPTLHYNK
jgi:hypothetical protein